MLRLALFLIILEPLFALITPTLHYKPGLSLKMTKDEHQVSFHVAGDAYVDFFCFLDDGGWPENGGDSRLEQPVKSYAGGSSTNTATHLRSLVRHFGSQEPNVFLHTVLNPEDHYGELLLNHAASHDFPIINCRKETDHLSTGHCIAIVSGGERSFMTHQGCVGKFNAEDLKLEEIISTPGDVHFHVAGFYNIPGFWNHKLEQRIKELRDERQKRFPESSTTISLVTQHDATREWDGKFVELLPSLDFAIMNDLEARNIVKRGLGDQNPSSDDEISAWASFFGSRSPETVVIVTRGELGAVALKGGKMIVDQFTIAVKPVDPTGAGDSFTAGFLHGLWTWKLANRSTGDDLWPLEAIKEGLRWGCAVGRAAILIRGASVPPPPENIENFRRSLETKS